MTPDLFDTPIPERYPSAPGVKEHGGTSQEAADKIQSKAKVIKARIFLALRRYGPMTPDECAGRLEEKVGNVRPRFSEMKKGGILRKTEQTRPNADGNNQRVFELVEDKAQ
jgi:hypothetical protein